jgi:hypothetical protein
MEARKNWKHFGNSEPACVVCDEVCIEYNPDIYKSKKTKKYIMDYVSEFGGDGSDTSKFEMIGCDDDTKFYQSMTRFGYKRHVLDNGVPASCRHCGSNHWSKDCTVKKYYKQLDDIDNKFSKKRIKTNDAKSKESSDSQYSPPHKRQSENKGFSVRLVNIPVGISTDGLNAWLEQFNIGRFRLHRPKDNYKGGFRDFAFLNFVSEESAILSTHKIQRVKLGNYIITAEMAKY